MALAAARDAAVGQPDVAVEGCRPALIRYGAGDRGKGRLSCLRGSIWLLLVPLIRLLGAVRRLLVLLPAEQNLEQSGLMRRRGVGRHFMARPVCPAATDFPFRFGRLRFPDRRRAFLLRGHGQFKRRGLADFDWNASPGRLINRARFFRIRVASVGGEARDFGLCVIGVSRRVGQPA